jgi:hypothetical protein
MEERVCPWWLGYLLASPVRRLSQDPGAILAPYVREGATVLAPGPGMGFLTLTGLLQVQLIVLPSAPEVGKVRVFVTLEDASPEAYPIARAALSAANAWAGVRGALPDEVPPQPTTVTRHHRQARQQIDILFRDASPGK